MRTPTAVARFPLPPGVRSMTDRVPPSHPPRRGRRDHPLDRCGGGGDSAGVTDPSPLQDPRFAFRRRLGGGGQAETWLAVEQATGREVAIKIATLSRMDDNRDVERWEREVATLRSLDHPRVPRLVDAFVEERPAHDRAYVIVQTYIDGQSLAEHAAAGRRWQARELADLARQALETLDALHRLTPPVIHRDLKPSNLVLDRHGQLWLIDFGAVQAVVPPAPLGGSTVVGTFGYMPPEQLVGRAGPSSDLYALGVTLIHLASGHPPSQVPVERMRLRFRPLVALPPAICDLLERLVEPMEEDRLPTARAALDALEAAVAPPLARPQPAAEWPSRARRGRWGWGAVAVLVALAAVALLQRQRPPAPAPLPIPLSAPGSSREAQHGAALPGAETGGQLPVALVSSVPGVALEVDHAHIMALGLRRPLFTLSGRLRHRGPDVLEGLTARIRLLDPVGQQVDASRVSLGSHGAAI